MRRFLSIIIIAALLPGLAGCALFPAKKQGVEQLLVVQAMGVDREGPRLVLSMVSAADSSRGEGPVRLSGSGPTLAQAQRDIALRSTEEELLCAHTGHILLGEDSAGAALGEVLDAVCRSRELRMDVPLYILRGGSAELALLHAGDERIGAVEQLDALSAAAVARDGEKPPSAARIAAAQAGDGCALIAALRCAEAAEQGEDGAVLTLLPDGRAIVRGGDLLGYLEQEDMLALDLLRGARGVHTLPLTLPDGQTVTVQTAPGSTRRRLLRTEAGTPTLGLEISLSASVLEIRGGGVAEDGALGAALEQELLRRALRLVRLQRSLGADFLGLGDRPLHLTVSARISHTGDLRDAP